MTNGKLLLSAVLMAGFATGCGSSAKPSTGGSGWQHRLGWQHWLGWQRQLGGLG